MSTLLGIDIGGTAVKIGVVDENGKVLLSETRSVSFDGYKTSIMTTVANLAGEVLEKSPVKIEGIGVSATGQIDVNSGTVIGVVAQTVSYTHLDVYQRQFKNTGDPSLSMAIGLYQSIVGFILVFTANCIVRRKFPDGTLF